MRFEFEWDEEKAKSNFRKHGVDFDVACEVFKDPLATYKQDRFVDGEERWNVVGTVGRITLIVAFATYDERGCHCPDHRLQEGRIVRSDEISKEERERRIAESIKRLDAMTDDDIDYLDIPEWKREDFARADRGKFYRPVKEQVTLRLDRYIIEWFRENNEKYQTAINAALLEHIRRERAAKAAADE